MTTLQPCPFCGSKDIEVEREGTNRQSCIISCADCGCRLESNEIGSGQQWNKRLMTTPAPNKIGKYIEAIEAIEAMCGEEGGNPEFKVFRPCQSDGWLASFAKRESKPNIIVCGPTLEDAVLNLKRMIDDGH